MDLDDAECRSEIFLRKQGDECVKILISATIGLQITLQCGANKLRSISVLMRTLRDFSISRR